jgi:hypothetical protein
MRSFVAVVLLVLSGASAESAVARQQPELVYLDHFDLSRPLRAMPLIPPDWRALGEEHPVGRLPHHHAARSLATSVDSALQVVVGPQVAAAKGLNFDGVGVGLGTFQPSGAPPDTNGAVGATQYVQWVNTAFAIFNKTTGAKLYGPASGSSLWQGFGGPCEAKNDGDPIALYDKLAQRWLMTQFAVSGGPPFYQCVAVSTTPDATGSYRRFAYAFPDFNDYPKAGVWPDAYMITFNMFDAAGTSFLGAKVCAFDRNRMITASGTPAPMQCFALGPNYGGLLPADLDGTKAPPAGAPNIIFGFDDATLAAVNLWRFRVNWTTPSSSSLTGPVKVAVPAFTEACGGGTCIPQAGTTQKLDSLADRAMYRLAYRNFGDHESLVVNHSVNVAGHSGIRWYEIRNPAGTPVLYQRGTFSQDANHRWMGSVAMDRNGNMLMGYSVSGSGIHPAIRYTGRLAADARHTMQAETTMFAGTGSQTASLSRWGDYAAMTVDPSDDCTFWFTTEDLKANGTYNWSTRIGSFKFASCAAPATGPTTVLTDGAESAGTTLVASATTTSTVWIREASGPYAGSWRWHAGGSTGGSYGVNGDARLTTPALDLSGASTATLTYAYKHSTEASADFFQVRVSTDGGGTWTNLVNLSGASAGWSAWAGVQTLNLNAYAGNPNLKLQFRLTTNGSVGAFGVALDEIKLVKQ